MKLLMIPFLALLLVAVSGCTDPAEPTGPAVDGVVLSVDGVVLETVPEGFEYLGAHDVEADDIRVDYVDVEGILNASEAFYNLDSADYWIMGVEMDSVESAENFITQYKAGFGSLAVGNRFAEVPFNEHDATVITKYITAGGEYNVPRYSYVWNNENFVFLVKGNTDDAEVVLNLAKATGF
ncbi:hypothetical protein [Methanococcoides alaskense]|nr:hypothetical protein [Methanococcoides alaskense]MDA0524775.1 hypothetical protein [Methanococcoides alaskense]